MKIGTTARSLKSLEKTADEWFSKYIRLKHADGNGMVKCVTCGKEYHWKEIDCGHFSTRNHKINRYREANCSPQCVHCNRYKNGEQARHGKYIDETYGAGTSDYILSLEKGIFKRSKFDLMYIIDEYKQKVKQLLREHE